MAKIKRIVAHSDPNKVIGYNFFCRGCNGYHMFHVGEWEQNGQKKTGWKFNGDMDNPTFTPSLLVYEGLYPNGDVGHPRCHLFVRDGKIQYLGDCGHKLAAQTIDMKDVV